MSKSRRNIGGRPHRHGEPSEHTSTRIPKSLKRFLKREAKRLGMSSSEAIVACIWSARDAGGIALPEGWDE